MNTETKAWVTIAIIGIIFALYSGFTYDSGYRTVDTFYIQEGETITFDNFSITLIDAVKSKDWAIIIITLNHNNTNQTIQVDDYGYEYILNGEYRLTTEFSGDKVSQIIIQRYIGNEGFWWDRLI